MPSQTRHPRALLAIAALALMVTGHTAHATVTVTVNGDRVLAPRSASVGQVAAAAGGVVPGDLVDATDHRVVLVPRGGAPLVVLVDGVRVDPASAVAAGDVIVAFSGTDLPEPTIVETVTIAPPSRTVGAGSIEHVESQGRAGTAVVTRGAVSGTVVTSETVEPPVPAVIRRTPAPGDMVIALTFDDGPWPGQTEEVLRILAETGTRATFFVVGVRADVIPLLIRAIAEGGHVIGNHTYRHAILSSADPALIATEIGETNRAIAQTTGSSPVWFRAPGGGLGPGVAEEIAQLGMRSALWTIDPKDWRPGVTAEEIAGIALGGAHPGGIILLHDGGGDRTQTILALPAIIDGLKLQGYTLVTLDELAEVKASW